MHEHDADGRRILAVVAFVFVVLLTGCAASSPVLGGTGEMTVRVVDSNGEPLDKQPVSIRNRQTKTTVFEGKTGPNGRVTTTLEQGTYVVASEDTTHTVTLDEDAEEIEISVPRNPPNSNTVAPFVFQPSTPA